MDKAAFITQINGALAQARRTIRRGGIIAILIQGPIVILMFVLVRAHSTDTAMVTYFAIALPISTAVVVALIVAINKSFARSAPVCPSCERAVGLFTWRRAVASRKCPHCKAALFETAQSAVPADAVRLAPRH